MFFDILNQREAKNMNNKVLLIFTIIILLLSSCYFVPVSKENEGYILANSLLKEGKIKEAYDIFLSIKDYKDTGEILDKFVYLPTKITTTDYGFGEDMPPAVLETVYTYDKNKYRQNENPVDFSDGIFIFVLFTILFSLFIIRNE